jgi:hypothetical protein
MKLIFWRNNWSNFHFVLELQLELFNLRPINPYLMKKILLLLVVGAFAASCSKEAKITETITIPQTQKTLLIYKGATWCGPCGSSGKPVLRAMEAIGEDKVICLASQTNDGLNSPAGDLIGNNLMTRFSQNGIPHMFESGNGNTYNFYPNQGTATNNMNAINGKSANVNAYVSASTTGSTIEVKAKTKFFAAGSGEYYLSVLVLEDNINKTQSGSSNPEHDNVIRGNGGSSAWGEKINSTTMDAEQEFSYSIAIDPSWKKENLKIATVIWKKNGTNYDAENASATKVVLK